MADTEPESFAAKLALVLKILAISRGRLAADLAVDKSVVSRWMSGATVPSGENMAALTRLVAGRFEGFTGLDWERSAADLASRIAHSGPESGFGLAASKRPAEDLDCFTGFWNLWRLPFGNYEGVMRDAVWMRIERGALAMTLYSEPIIAEGSVLISDTRAHMIFTHPFDEVPGTMLLYTATGKLQKLDGIFTTVTGLASRAVVAAPVVLERFAELSGDAATDRRLFEAVIRREQLVEPTEVPPAILRRITREVGAAAALRLSADDTLARDATAAEMAVAEQRTRCFAETGELRP